MAHGVQGLESLRQRSAVHETQARADRFRDGALGRSRWGTRWALAALAAGAAGSAAVLRAPKEEVEKNMERPAAEAEPVTAAS